MGTLRFLLAITVLLSHTYGHIFTGGRLAVQMFYIISGFLISYILIGQIKTLNLFMSVFTALILTFSLSLIIEHVIHPKVERKRLLFKR